MDLIESTEAAEAVGGIGHRPAIVQSVVVLHVAGGW